MASSNSSQEFVNISSPSSQSTPNQSSISQISSSQNEYNIPRIEEAPNLKKNQKRTIDQLIAFANNLQQFKSDFKLFEKNRTKLHQLKISIDKQMQIYKETFDKLKKDAHVLNDRKQFLAQHAKLYNTELVEANLG